MPFPSTEPNVLSIDLGGTNMSLAAVVRAPGGLAAAASRRYPTREQSGPSGPIEDFIAYSSSLGLPRPSALCLASAGVVTAERIDANNVPWPVERRRLEEALGIPVRLINDFQAVMKGILSVDPADGRYFKSLKPARPAPASALREPICAIGPGTGLGFGYAVPSGSGYAVFASEGGNGALPAWDGESRELWEFLHAKLGGEPCAEDAVSGPGIARIFEFEAGRSPGGKGENRIRESIFALPEAERPRAVSEAASTDPLCARTMERFALTLAVVASGAALSFMPTGGLFLAGGVCAKNLSVLASDRFAARFLSHRNAACVRLLDRVPLYAVSDYSISILGSAAAAFESIDAEAKP